MPPIDVVGCDARTARHPPEMEMADRLTERFMLLDAPLPPLEGNPLLEQRRRLGPIGRDDPRRDRLVHGYAYGVPTDAALDAIAAASPAGVVELGAGTGYWARLLHQRGVDIVAYDTAPPETGTNRFVDAAPAWFPVAAGDQHVIDSHADRTLLLVWPTWNETWAGDAAAAFHAAGGRTLVYVGEGPGGRTGDTTLHARLGVHGPCLACTLGVTDQPCVCGIDVLWELLRTVPLPRWADTEDSCGIYRRLDQSPRPRRRLLGVRGRRGGPPGSTGAIPARGGQLDAAVSTRTRAKRS